MIGANLPAYEAESLADDVVIETPFAAPGRPTRTEGRERGMEYTQAGRAAFRSGSTTAATWSCTRPLTPR
jgi:ketosteroid isomerase-like protein